MIGMQKYMFMDLFIRAAPICLVPAVGRAEWGALRGGRVSTPLLVSPLKGDW